MTISTSRHGEPLFLVILRDPLANTLLKTWISDNRIKHAQLAENRMQLFDQHSLNMFVVTWKNSWNNVIIWDAWNRRHIYTK
jgi:hypothetical protein